MFFHFEIWHMGWCPACTKRQQTSKYGRDSLYLDHVTVVAQFIKENYPNLKIIIWDDMLRNMDLKTLQGKSTCKDHNFLF